MRPVTSARASISPRAVATTMWSPFDDADLGGKFRRELGEELRLQLREMRERARHRRPRCGAR